MRGTEKVLAVLGGLPGMPFPIVVSLANALSVYGERPLKYLCGVEYMYIISLSILKPRFFFHNLVLSYEINVDL